MLSRLGRGGHHDDDTALLAIRLVPSVISQRPPLRGSSTLALPRHPCAASTARTFVFDTLRRVGLAEHAYTIGLLTSELVTNGLRHAEGHLRLELVIGDDSLRVDVSDGSAAQPALRPPASDRDESGRGLMLVEALSDRWGSERLATGKRVWFEIALPSAAAASTG